MSSSLDMTHVVRGGQARAQVTPASFCLSELAGRLVELSGQGACATLTWSMALVRDAQRQQEPVAWISSAASMFYPPDAADSGVDLSALVVIRIPLSDPSTGSKGSQRAHAALAVAAERLLRSGAFGLVIIDLYRSAVLAQPMQSRLLGLAQKHHSVCLCLTEKARDSASLGSLVSLRGHALRRRLSRDQFECVLDVVKDKRRGPTWSQSEVFRGPLGLR